MGSSGSKPCGGNGAPSSSSSVRQTRSRGSRVFQSSCLGTSSRSHDSDNDDKVSHHQNKENGSNSLCADHSETESNQVKVDCFRKVKVEGSHDMSSISSNVELDAWGQTNVTSIASGAGSSSVQASSIQSSSRFFSRLSFIPGNISFRLNRAASIGSSRAYPVSTDFTPSNNEEHIHLPTACNGGSNTRNEARQASVISENLQGGRITPACDIVGEGCNTRMGVELSLHPPRVNAETDNIENRLADRRIGSREPVERNVRFSRTLSVGRLRDRVLRRSSFSDLTIFPPRQEREEGDASLGSERQAWDSGTRALAIDGSFIASPTASGHSPPGMSNSVFSNQDYEMEISRSREARYHDLLEHRSNFLERRRRIRSQVRALQRLGNRFENISGHERSCILSGQHRTGRCTCHLSSRDAHSNDDTNARASISRIVMLAEALFEVLDEIHQQSVVLSSRPSVSSIGSVPAPNEVVESLPVKLYAKSQKHQIEEAAQCYICLVEYEDGDIIRLLPCHHEFHKSCIDKWLKEIHRVCPLCRGNICRSDSSPAEN